MEKKCKKAKWLSEEDLKIVEEREAKVKGGGEERYTHLKEEFLRIVILLVRRDKMAFLNEKCKEIEENNRIGNTALQENWR